MKSSRIHLHSNFQVGPVDPRVFGGFLKHMGRAVYQGVYDPDCAHAHEDGFRTDMLNALKRLRMAAIAVRGGNVVEEHYRGNAG